MNHNIEFLDCTLRDGGYYNNWNFEKKLVNKYLKAINETKIRYIELGFISVLANKLNSICMLLNAATISGLDDPFPNSFIPNFCAALK